MPAEDRDGRRKLDAENPQDSKDKPGYYDVPMLKKPVWKWEVALYFFFGGLSAGAYILARLAERFGGKEQRAVTRAGTAVAALAAIPCTPLLIIDLGDPKRFHHMLRIWKPNSPMNLGSWTLTGYSGVLAMACARELVRGADAPAGEIVHIEEGGLLDELSGAVADGAGIPLAIVLAGYTGVLLSGTATPIWAKNPYLGALFSASAMSTGTAAVSLALEAADAGGPSRAILYKVETVARLSEAAALTGYLTSAGEFAKPLTQGKYAKHLWAGTVGLGLAAPMVLDLLPVSSKWRRWFKILAAICSLIGGLSTRWCVLYAGHDSADDPEAARAASRGGG